jgi:hypothetical protein
MATVPKPPTTPTTISIADEIFNNVFSPTPTPTTVVGQPKSTVPKTNAPKTNAPIIKSDLARAGIPLSEKLNEQILYKQSQLYGTKYSSKEIEKAKPDLPWYKDVALGALDTFIVKPLNTLDFAHRVVISTIKETADLVQAVKGKQALGGGTSGFGIKDWWNQSFDTNTSGRNTLFKGVKPTGNKWIDGTIFLAIDAALDPVTYLTLGTGTAAKIGMKQLVGTIGKEAVQAIAENAAKDIATKGAKQAAKEAAIIISKELGESATKKEIQVAARSVIVEAAKLAEEQALLVGNKAAAAAAKKAGTQAISRYSAVGPRRTLGSKTKVALADSLQTMKEEAIIEAKQFAGTARGRLAQKFVDTITPEVIGNVATKGYAGMRGPVAELVGVKGGLKWGLPFLEKVSIRGSERLTNPIGNAAASLRKGVWNWGKYVNQPGAKILGALTKTGGSEAIWDMRTGLKSGTLQGEKAVQAVKLLSEDVVNKGFEKLSAASSNTAIRKIVSNSEYKPYLNTVHEVLSLPIEQYTGDAVEVAARLGRPLSEIKMAQEVAGFGEGLHTIVSNYAIQNAAAGFPGIVKPTKWFPQAIVNKASRWLASGSKEAREILTSLRLDAAPVPGQNIASALNEGSSWFGHALTETQANSVKELNRLANNPHPSWLKDGKKAFDGQFFETNVAAALQKYSSKFAKDYAFMRMVEQYSEGAAAVVRPKFQTEAQIVSRAGEIDTKDYATQLVKNVSEWTEKDVRQVRGKIVDLAEDNKTAPIVKEYRDAVDNALQEVDNLLAGFDSAIATDADLANVYLEMAAGLTNNYYGLFSRPVSEVKDFIKTMDPTKLKTIVNLIEDSYVKLDSAIIPDGYVRSDIAEIYKNIMTLKSPKARGEFLSFLQDYNQFIKTWLITTPGFHSRNTLSGSMQMLSGGGKYRYLKKEGLPLSREWNAFLKKQAENIDTFTYTPDELIDVFLIEAKVPKNQAYAFKNAMEIAGASGYGMAGEVAAGTTKGVTGISGREMQASKTALGKARNIVSRGFGKTAETSQAVGQSIENHMRFMFTYDGIRQGLSPAEAAARTSKFLIDYADTSTVDQALKQIVPFWMFMSNNLPAQIENMFYNPQVYQRYNQIRKAYTDEDGNNMLIPEWLSNAGAFPIAGRLLANPNFGFPGAGSPSPLETGFTDRRGILGSVAPQYLTILELLLGEKAATGEKLEGFGELAGYAGQRFGGPVGTASRYLNPLIAGTDIPGLKSIPGIKKAEEPGSANYEKLNSAFSLFGIPLKVNTANQENSARIEIIKKLNEMLKNK